MKVSRVAAKREREESADTSLLRSKKINFDDDMNFDVNMISLTVDLGDNVVNLEEETSPHTSSTAYHSGSSNSIVSTSSTSAAIINTTSDSSSTTTTSSCTVVPMKEYNFLYHNHFSSIVGDHQFLINSNEVDSTGAGLSITQNVQPPTEVRLNEP